MAKDDGVNLNNEITETCKDIIHNRNQLSDLASAFKRVGNQEVYEELIGISEALYSIQAHLKDEWHY